MKSNFLITFRDGATELFHLLATHDVPLLIFSAGLGDLIEEVMNHHAKIDPNIHIVSNYMSYNEQVRK